MAERGARRRSAPERFGGYDYDSDEYEDEDEYGRRKKKPRRPLADFVPRAGVKRTRCGRCNGCMAGNCGKCKYCKDMPKYGGTGKMRQTERETSRSRGA